MQLMNLSVDLGDTSPYAGRFGGGPLWFNGPPMELLVLIATWKGKTYACYYVAFTHKGREM
jgi:hypothetical protein